MDGPDLPFSPPAHPTEINARLSLSFYSTSLGVSQYNELTPPAQLAPRLDPNATNAMTPLLSTDGCTSTNLVHD
jgi:hypothetical protein